MKRLIFSLALFSSFIYAHAQGEMDALKYSQTDLIGTARYMSMGGAFGALGGDASCLSNNPAGLGVYRKSELSFSPSMVNNNTQSTNPTYSINDSRWDINLNNFAFITSYLTGRDKGLVASNFGISFNRIKNYNSDRDMKTVGSGSSITDNMASMANAGYEPSMSNLGQQAGLITADANGNYSSFLNAGEKTTNNLSISERGSVNEWDFSYGANFNNNLYLGATLGVQSIDYQTTTDYTETYQDGGYLHIANQLQTTGVGFNLKVGTIFRPVDFMRVGLAFHTPTVYNLQDTYSGSADYNISSSVNNVNLPYGVSSYQLNTPYKFIGSLAFVLSKEALISADYEMTDYTNMNFGGDFGDVNQWIKEDFQISNTLRLGAEYRLGDGYSLRCGYAFTTSPVKASVEDNNVSIITAGTTPNYTIPKDNSYYTIGFGYRENNFFFDAAYVLNIKNEDVYPYYMADVTKVTSTTNNLVLTFGWKF
jgi:long-subunit fatty acid transport protein